MNGIYQITSALFLMTVLLEYIDCLLLFAISASILL